MGAMSGYRAYRLTADGHVAQRIDLEAQDDDAALAEARKHVDECVIELWKLDRLLRRLSPADTATRVD